MTGEDPVSGRDLTSKKLPHHEELGSLRSRIGIMKYRKVGMVGSKMKKALEFRLSVLLSSQEPNLP